MERFELWEGAVPGGKAEDGAPYIRYYKAEEKRSNAAVLICPSGGADLTERRC